MSYKGTPASSQIIWLEQRVEQLTSGPGGIMEMKQTIADKERRIEKLEEALCNVTTAWDLWQKASDSNSFTELFVCICEAKALEKEEPLEWTENYGQGSEPWLNKE